jgi:hypothetical protein
MKAIAKMKRETVVQILQTLQAMRQIAKKGQINQTRKIQNRGNVVRFGLSRN